MLEIGSIVMTSEEQVGTVVQILLVHGRRGAVIELRDKTRGSYVDYELYELDPALWREETQNV